MGLRAQYLRGVGLMYLTPSASSGMEVISVNYNYSTRIRSRSALTWQP